MEHDNARHRTGVESKVQVLIVGTMGLIGWIGLIISLIK